MSMNRIARIAVTLFALLILAVLAWRHRHADWVQDLLRPAAPAKAIVFDNGSVRDAMRATASDGAATKLASDPNNQPGKLKKCQRHEQVVYTDQPCPAGFSAAPVATDKVSVIGGAAPKSSPGKPVPADAQKTLHDALDLSENTNLRDKMMERAINR